jgi:hypothetical protein
MKKIAIFGFSWFFSMLAQAAIQIQVNPTHVDIDESFRITITQNDVQNRGIPDLTPLQKDFMVLSTEQHMNYSFINGKAQSSNEWIITLKAQKEGRLTIPVIQIGHEHTTPITIEVTSNTTLQNTTGDINVPQQNRGIYLTTTVNKKNPYVNQQIIYKVTLYNSQRLLKADYQGPQVDNALVIPLGAEKRYQTQKDNRTYLVEEQNYAIFPQKNGILKIKSPVLTALIYDFNPQRVKTLDKNISLKIQPIPKSYSGTEWLPAKKVTLTEQYENSAQKLAQGNTLMRTVMLEGVGIPAQLLPNLNFKEAAGFHVYPERGQNQNQLVQGELISHIDIKVTYLLNQPGKITIPELKLPWFNTETGKEEIAILPEKTIEVIPSTATSITNTNKIMKQNEPSSPSPQKPNHLVAGAHNHLAWIIAALFTSGCLFALFLWRQKNRNPNGKSQYKSALIALQEACLQNDPQRTRDALLKWANVHWPNASLFNLTDLTQLTTDPSFKKQIQLLSQTLYKNQEKPFWQGEELWHSIQQIKKNNGVKKDQGSSLPPINPP